MFSAIKDLILNVAKVPPEPLDPMGDVRELRVFRASRGYYRYRLLGWFLGTAVGGLILVAVEIGLGAWGHSAGGGWALVSGLGALALAALYLAHCAISYAFLRLDYEMRWYKVTDRSLRIREGVVTVREMTMTFANVQNIEIQQGPLQKLFGISDLRVRSAGGGSERTNQPGVFDAHSAYFRGVDNAAEIRDMMLARLRRLRDGGLGDHEDAGLEHGPAGPDGGVAALPATPAVPRAGAGLDILHELAAESRRMRLAAQALAGDLH